MYLARFTRPDILFATTYLATKCNAPTVHDMEMVSQIFSYLSTVPDYVYVFSGDELKLQIYVDASYGLHPDGKGHLGIFITFGSAPITQKSMKQKTVSLSSTEAEVIAVVEAITYIIWLIYFLDELGFQINLPVPIYQDNISAIILYNGGGIFKRSKHMLIKTSYVNDIIKNKIAIFKHLNTEQHPADILTKPVLRSAIVSILNSLHIMPE
jgi:hypothetical protein